MAEQSVRFCDGGNHWHALLTVLANDSQKINFPGGGTGEGATWAETAVQDLGLEEMTLAEAVENFHAPSEGTFSWQKLTSARQQSIFVLRAHACFFTALRNTGLKLGDKLKMC